MPAAGARGVAFAFAAADGFGAAAGLDAAVAAFPLVFAAAGAVVAFAAGFFLSRAFLAGLVTYQLLIKV
jgi:hypothetical protein